VAIRQNLSTNIRKKTIQTTWSGLLNLDTGNPETFNRYTGRVVVQVLGTFGVGGSVSIEGSSDGGTTWVTIFDNRGTGSALTFTANGMRSLNEVPNLIRPNVTAGDGTTNLKVIITGSL
jgi:hypothetical protein